MQHTLEHLEPRRLFAATVTQTATIAPSEISESSGVFASRLHPGILYTHNDAGNDSEFFAISRKGALIGRYSLNVSNIDFEEITADDAGHLFIADTGNNDLDRQTVIIHRIAEPAPTTHHGGKPERRALTVERSYTLRWPGARLDAEALIIQGSVGYLISKEKSNAKAQLFRFTLGKARGERLLTKIAELNIRTPITAAALSASGRTLAVVAPNKLYLFTVHGNIPTAANISPKTIALPDRNIEGVTFLPTGGLLLTAESREIYFVQP